MENEHQRSRVNPLIVIGFLIVVYFSIYAVYSIDYVFLGRKGFSKLPTPVQNALYFLLDPVLRLELRIDRWVSSF